MKKIVNALLILVLTNISLCFSTARETQVFGAFATPDEVVDFLPFSREKIEHLVQQAQEQAVHDVHEILCLSPEKRTFENTVQALDEAERKVELVSRATKAVFKLSPDPEVRRCAASGRSKLVEFAARTFMADGLYRAFSEYLEKKDKKRDLNSEEQYYLNAKMRLFRHEGAHCAKDEHEKIVALKVEINDDRQKFVQAYSSCPPVIYVADEELTGLGQDYINSFPVNTEGKRVVKCNLLNFGRIARNCTCQQTRKKVYLAYNSIGYPENQDNLQRLVELRQRLAVLMGYKSYAHYSLDMNMARTPERVADFLKDLAERISPKELLEVELLKQNLPEGVMLTENGLFEPWDILYVQEQFLQKGSENDTSDASDYFPVERTVEKLLNFYQDLFGLSFEMCHPQGLWHDDVSCVAVKDKATQELRGYFFLDLFSREGKFKLESCYSIAPAIKSKDNGGVLPAVCVLIAGYPKSSDERIARLPYEEAAVLSHEFGHVIHSILGRTQFAELSLINAEDDFLELPGMLFENIFFVPDVLKYVSGHYETGEQFSDAKIQHLLAKRRSFSGIGQAQQVLKALFSLSCFLEGSDKDVPQIWIDLNDRLRPYVRFDSNSHFETRFVHLATDGPGVYGYFWSEVFALDCLKKLRVRGGLDTAEVRRFAELVLEPAGSNDANNLLHDFLGREPDQEAYFDAYGFALKG